MEVALVLLPPLVHAYARGNGFAQLGLIVVVFVGALVVGVALPGQAANVVICYKTTSMIWDATQGQAVPNSPEILERLPFPLAWPAHRGRRGVAGPEASLRRWLRRRGPPAPLGGGQR